MFSKNSTHKCLLAIEPYKFTGKQVGKLRDNAYGRDYRKYLPEYCIKDDGSIGWSENYHQFTGEYSNGDEEFIFFHIYTADKLLQEEINYSGFEGKYSLLSSISNWEQIITGIIKDKFTIYNYDNYKESLITPQYIVIQLHYYTYGYPDYDWDMDVELLGYLDSDLQLKEYNYEDQKSEGIDQTRK